MTYWVVVFEPAQDLDAILFLEDASADDSLVQSATDERQIRAVHTLQPPVTAKTGTAPGGVYG
jgi:hypothetical protein